MLLLPFDTLSISTNLTVAEVQSQLEKVVGPPRVEKYLGYFRSTSSFPYEGKMEENQFRISRCIQYRNSFLPIIKGNITESAAGAQINLTMRMEIWVILFMTVWLGFTGVGTLFSIQQMFNPYGFHPLFIMPIFLFVFGYILMLLGFKYESRKTKSFFISHFGAGDEMAT